MIEDFKRPGHRPLPKQNTQRNIHQTTRQPSLAARPSGPAPEHLPEGSILDPDIPGPPPEPPKHVKKSPFAGALSWWHNRSKKQKIILITSTVTVLVLLSGGGAYAYFATRKKPVPPPAPAPTKQEPAPVPAKPTTEASRLTGVQIAPELNARSVTGVMIENSPDARPQSGLKEAGVIYEAVAEGGITRFLALFQEARPERIGPIRSARPYYIDWLLGYDGAYAHVGGSPDALAMIKANGVKDLDQFHNSGAYERVSTRYAPHNVYSSMAKLDDLKNKKGFTASTFTGFERKAEAPAPTPPVKSIDLSISGLLYNVHYDYDQPSNTYRRSMGGKPHTDEPSASQLTPKIVVALVIQKGLAADRLHSTYKNIGSGTAFVFQDGYMMQGTWSKDGQKAPVVLKDPSGAPLKLNPGQTWVTAIADTGAMTMK